MVNTRQISGRRHPLCLLFLVQSLAFAQDFVDIPIVLDSHLHLVKLVVDALPQMPIVDTGCPLTMFVLEEWYEKRYHPKRCWDAKTLCYNPIPDVPCHPEANTTLWFPLEGEITIFSHQGMLEIDRDNLGDFEFSLICDKKDLGEPAEPLSLFGLGMRANKEHQLSIMEQLHNKGTINDLSFSLYLEPSGDLTSSGLLRMGGSDPEKYIHPMEYVPTAPGWEWSVGLQYVDVDHHRLPAMGDKAFVDTGTNYVRVPAKHWQTFREYLERAAGFTFDVIQPANIFKVPCDKVGGLPDIHFGIRGFHRTYRFSIAPSVFVKPLVQDSCYLKFDKSPESNWIIPNLALLGQYLHFSPHGVGAYERPVIGVAKLKGSKRSPVRK